MATEIRIHKGSAVGVLTPSTEADFAYINAHLRSLDRFEQEHFMRAGSLDRPDSLDMMETSWTLHLRDEIVGYVALMVPSLQSPLSHVRFVPMLSTENVSHHPLDYARLSRPILEWVLDQAPAWVTDFYSFPLAKYDAAVRWHEKTMRWHKVGEFDAEGEKVFIYHISRKEMEK